MNDQDSRGGSERKPLAKKKKKKKCHGGSMTEI